MTLQLRKKHQTTAKSIRHKTTETNSLAGKGTDLTEKGSDPLKASRFHFVNVLAGEGQTPFRTGSKVTGQSWLSGAFKAALLSGCSMFTVASLDSVVVAQPPAWQPTRMPSQTDARPLAASSQVATNQASQSTSQGSGVALRWKSVKSSPVPASNTASTTADSSTVGSNSVNTVTAFNTRSGLRAVQPAAAQANGSSNRMVDHTAGWTANPLRGDQGVRSANYQQPANDPFGDSRPQLPGGDLPSLPPNKMPAIPSEQLLPQDPLSNVEPPPAPDGEEVRPEPVTPSNLGKGLQGEPSPFDRSRNQKPDPFGDEEKDTDADKAMDDKADEGGDKREDLKMPKRKKNANTTSCNDMRDRVRQLRLTDISLDVSPEYGEGLRTREAGAKDRLDFAASAPIRDWTDYTGTIVATGRLIDLRDDRVVLDLNGREQTIPVRDLSDIDVAYVADAWNLPLQCGIGYEPYAGRQFIPSAVEWKASGLCHKPLYFEDVQLARYGHEVGPVLQPLLSSAHFFGNLLILPYKMGIHPPGECQYPLGYYRPGDCAPYMIQPFPFSLRGAAAQAGFVTGAGALIP